MNMLDLLKDKWMESWTGGLTGQPGRFHSPGTFDNFKFSDFFNNKNWVREADPTAPGGMRNYYRPGDSKTVKTVIGKDGTKKVTTTVDQTVPNPKELEDDFTKDDPYPYPSMSDWLKGIFGGDQPQGFRKLPLPADAPPARPTPFPPNDGSPPAVTPYQMRARMPYRADPMNRVGQPSTWYNQARPPHRAVGMYPNSRYNWKEMMPLLEAVEEDFMPSWYQRY